MAGQVMFFMAICYTYRSIPILDRRKIAVNLDDSLYPVKELSDNF